MKTIYTKKGQEIFVDDDVYEWAKSFTWRALKGGRGYYARTNYSGNGKKINLMLHKLIMGKKEGLVIDHINGNGLDNRRENLRHVTYQINSYNRVHLMDNKTSKYLGVCKIKVKKYSSWAAKIACDGRTKYLGLFKTEEEAHEAYLLAKDKILNNLGVSL